MPRARAAPCSTAPGGPFVAIDSRDGRHLWHYNLGQPLFASPITFEVEGKQYVTIAAQSEIFTFALFEPVESVPIIGAPTGQ